MACSQRRLSVCLRGCMSSNLFSSRYTPTVFFFWYSYMIYVPIYAETCRTDFRNFDFKMFGEFFLNFKFGLSLWNSLTFHPSRGNVPVTTLLSRWATARFSDRQCVHPPSIYLSVLTQINDPIGLRSLIWLNIDRQDHTVFTFISWPTFVSYLSTQCLEWNNVPKSTPLKRDQFIALFARPCWYNSHEINRLYHISWYTLVTLVYTTVDYGI